MDIIMTWVQQITSTIIALGYPGVFVALVIEGLGLPFPGDGFLAFYGYAISVGDMNGLAVLSIATLGYFCGVSIVFGLVKRFNNVLLDPLYRVHLLDEPKMSRTSTMMEKFGALVLIPGRFLPGVRSLSTYAAALGQMPYSTFSFYTLIGSFVWCGAWIGMGFWFGENTHALLLHARRTLTWMTVALLALALIVFVVRRIQIRARMGSGK